MSPLGQKLPSAPPPIYVRSWVRGGRSRHESGHRHSRRDAVTYWPAQGAGQGPPGAISGRETPDATGGEIALCGAVRTLGSACGVKPIRATLSKHKEADMAKSKRRFGQGASVHVHGVASLNADWN